MVQRLTPRSRCGVPRFDPWSGNQIPHALTQTQRSQISIFLKRLKDQTDTKPQGSQALARASPSAGPPHARGAPPGSRRRPPHGRCCPGAAPPGAAGTAGSTPRGPPCRSCREQGQPEPQPCAGLPVTRQGRPLAWRMQLCEGNCREVHELIGESCHKLTDLFNKMC